MASIPIQNETDYPLTEAITQQIIRDAQEHFGDEVRMIRVQSGIERHALNARTREVRYAFSPQDFGLSYPLPAVSEPSVSVADLPILDEEPADAILPGPFEDVADMEEEDTEVLETSLESLDEEQDDEEEDDVFRLDAPEEDADEDDEDNFLDDDEDNVFEDDEV